MLRLSKKADYGLIALSHLAARSATGTASAKEIAAAYHIPLPLLSKVLQTLARRGLLASAHGAAGGYRLARDASTITALDVIRAIDGPVLLTSCRTGDVRCGQSRRCTVREPLRTVHDGILRLLAGITISDLTGGTACHARGARSGGPLTVLQAL